MESQEVFQVESPEEYLQKSMEEFLGQFLQKKKNLAVNLSTRIPPNIFLSIHPVAPAGNLFL